MSDRLTFIPSRALLTLLFVGGLIPRIVLSFRGGIWRDEGLVLNILSIETVAGMIDYLRFHESHPPLFYLLLRGWQSIAGTSDAALLLIVSIAGASIVPVTFAALRKVVSRETALLAAALVAFSPSLIEHSAQIRPYGFLPILVLVSCTALVVALDRGGKRAWSAFALFTVACLYTHNWTWLVFGAQLVAAAVVVFRQNPDHRARSVRGLAGAVLGILIMFAPWMSSLVFQVVHAGHTAPPLYTAVGRIVFIASGLATIHYMLFLGSYPLQKLAIIGYAAAISLASALITLKLRGKRGSEYSGPSPEAGKSGSLLMVMLLVPAATLAAAFVLSPRSNLVLERCVVMLTPLLLVAIAEGLIRLSRGAHREAATVLAVFLLSVSAVDLFALLKTTRSNSREAAAQVAASVRSDDLLIVTPEWYAPSFNHYFPALVQQIDHPHRGRSRLLDFAGIRTRALDPASTAFLLASIDSARKAGRRVWLVTARGYVRYIDEELPKMSIEKQRNRYTSVLHVKEARDALMAAFGPPDTSHFVNQRVPRYEEIIPMLFAAPSSSPGGE